LMGRSIKTRGFNFKCLYPLLKLKSQLSKSVISNPDCSSALTL
jgi:hypothetical protein